MLPSRHLARRALLPERLLGRPDESRHLRRHSHRARPANEDRFSTLLLAAVTAVAVVAVAVTVTVAVATVVLLVEVEALSSPLASPSAPSDPSSPSRLVALPSPLPCRVPSADPSGPDALSEVGAPRRGIGALKAGDKGLVLWGLASKRTDWL